MICILAHSGFVLEGCLPALIVSNKSQTFHATEKALSKLVIHPEVREDLERNRIKRKI